MYNNNRNVALAPLVIATLALLALLMIGMLVKAGGGGGGNNLLVQQTPCLLSAPTACESTEHCRSLCGENTSLHCIGVGDGESYAGEGKYCLPPMEKPQCGNYGHPVWTRRGWKCLCSHEDVTNAATGRCDTLTGHECGQNGELVCPSSGLGGSCEPGEPWDGMWNPSDGECRCAEGYLNAFDEPTSDPNLRSKKKLCVKDKCTPGRFDGLNACICPEGYMFRDGLCVHDHCAPGVTSPEGTCRCPEGMMERDGSCETVCNEDVCQDRGQCYLPVGATTPKCRRCRKPYRQSPNKLCMSLSKLNGEECVPAKGECLTGKCVFYDWPYKKWYCL